MKIKIRKSLNEMKMGFNVANVLPYEDVIGDLEIFENLKLSQQEVQRILMKNIIFYDLETSGLSRKDDVIHQFAALKYSPEKLNTDPENPDDLYLSKCEVPRDVIAKKSRILFRRAEALKRTGYEKLKSALLFTNNYGKEFISPYWNYENTILPVFFFILIKNAIPDSKIEDKVNWHKNMQIGILDDNIYKYYYFFIDNLKKKIDDDPNSNSDLQIRYDALKNIFNETDPSIKQIRYFYDILFKEDDLVYYVVNNKSKNDVKKLKNRISQYKNLIGMSHQENQILTNAKDFPLERFREPEYGITMTGTQVAKIPEEQGLQGFINYITNISPVPAPTTDDILTLTPAEANFPTTGDTIIVGHNIVAFDNSFILKRCEVHGIDPKGFSDIFVYDTRSLFEYFLRYINYSKYALNFFRYVEAGKGMPEGSEFKKLWDSSGMSKIYSGLLTKTKSLSAKLEKFMKMYNKDAKQTHTADDDCIQLAKVFNGIRPEISKVMKDTVEIINFVESKKEFKDYYMRARGTKTFTKKAFGKTKAGEYKKKVMKKIEDTISNYEQYYSEPVIAYFEYLYPSGKKYKSQEQQELVKHMRSILNMSEEQVKQFYYSIIKWHIGRTSNSEEYALELQKQINIPPVEIKDTESGAKFSVVENKRNKIKVRVR